MKRPHVEILLVGAALAVFAAGRTMAQPANAVRSIAHRISGVGNAIGSNYIELARSEGDIQKLTDKAIKDVDDIVRAKEQELMAV